MYISDIPLRRQGDTLCIGQGIFNIHGVVALKFPHEMGLICISVLVNRILHTKPRISQNFIPKTLIAHKIAKLFGSNPDILMKQPFQLAAAYKTGPGKPVSAQPALLVQDLLMA